MPPGPRGLEPHIELTYDSQSGSGDMGIGRSLAGISSISRCNRTTAQNGTPAPVALTTSDAFCLDGAQPELTGGSYGAAGSTYQTEIANFEQVTAYGTAGNGPAYFIVQGPHGTQYEYGNGGAAKVLASGTSTSRPCDAPGEAASLAPPRPMVRQAMGWTCQLGKPPRRTPFRPGHEGTMRASVPTATTRLGQSESLIQETSMSNQLRETGWQRFLDRLKQFWGKASRADLPAATASATEADEASAPRESADTPAPSPGSP